MEDRSLQSRKLKVIISGGGTGGHIFPAVAIANELKNQNPENEILFVGANGRMEMEKVPAAGYKIVGLNILGIQRKFSLQNFLLPFKVIQSVLKARQIIKQFKPDVAVGVGGYASGPLLFAAGGRNIPTLIQEQNSFAGITNKLLAKRAKKICVAYEGMDRYFPKEKIILTGNPVREQMIDIDGKRTEALHFFQLAENKKIILVIGGSLGAGTINRSIEQGLAEIISNGYQLIWQTGKNYFQKAMSAVGENNTGGIKVFDFIQRMDFAYAAADLIISRAGASSVSELALISKPAILVPSPNVAEDHQTKNAMALVNRNAAVLVKDAEAEKKLISTAFDLIKDPVRMSDLSKQIRQMALPGAAHTIVNEVYKIAK
jgi:UDP-N-acetylglucosamine--N-acetylmuramyl-(pentapeptide) pyrophosphoryl-undecaprenol N-acetylglucosamine transferase